MLSRVAESLFWLGRNVERAETVARALDVNYNRAMDLFSQRDSEQLWRSVMYVAGFVEDPKIAAGPGSRAAAEAVAYCALDIANPCSIASCIRIARANALGIRAELTSEVWETLNVLYLYVGGQTLRGVMRDGPSKFLRRVRDGTLAFAGVVDGTLSHGDAWSFLQLGRYAERAFMTSRALTAADLEREPWRESQRLLEMCCASVPFVQESRHVPEPRDAIAFVLFSEECPRSLRFCVREMDGQAHRLTGSPEGRFANDAERRLGRLRARFDFTPMAEVLAGGIQTFANDTVGELQSLSREIEAAFFPRLPLGVLVE